MNGVQVGLMQDRDQSKLPAWVKRRLMARGDKRDESGETRSHLIPHYIAWTLLVWTILSGLLLVTRYRPTTAWQAQRNSEALLNGGGIFEILAGFHRWAAFLMVLSILLHNKSPRLIRRASGYFRHITKQYTSN